LFSFLPLWPQWSARIEPNSGSEDEETHAWWWFEWDALASEWEKDEKRASMLEAMRKKGLVAR
jgi:hypothetical protein